MHLESKIIFQTTAAILWLLTSFSFATTNIPWSWERVNLWADIGTQDTSLTTDYQAKFLGSHYKFISIEKCIGDPPKSNRSTEDAFYQVASQIRQYSPWINGSDINNTNNKQVINNTHILFYFSVSECYCKCYNITKDFCSNESMWLKNSSGYPILGGKDNNDKNYPYFDMTQEYVQDWWTNAVYLLMVHVIILVIK